MFLQNQTLPGNEFDLDPHTQSGRKPAKRTKRRVCAAVFQLAYVGLSDPRLFRELFLGEPVCLPGVDQGLNYLMLNF